MNRISVPLFIVAFVGGLCAGSMLDHLHAKPPALTCGMTTRDGCVMWFDPVKIERFKQGKAGTPDSARYGDLVTGRGAQ